MTIELYSGPEDGHQLDLPGEKWEAMPPAIKHFGILYLYSEMTTEDGLPVYVHVGKSCRENREGQI